MKQSKVIKSIKLFISRKVTSWTHIFKRNGKEVLTTKKYSEQFPEGNSNTVKSQREKAFEKAWEIRDFEIKLYWERAKYFWAFIASTFVAYFASLGDIAKSFYQLQFIIICIGFVFSIAWWLVNLSSKHWQENWEGHIDRLEDGITGPLYKTVKNYSVNFSVSKINIVVSFFISSVWLLFCAIYYKKYLTIESNLPIAWIELISFVIVLATILSFFVYATTGKFPNKAGYYKRDIK